VRKEILASLCGVLFFAPQLLMAAWRGEPKKDAQQFALLHWYEADETAVRRLS
jgi:hypothetical protein